MDFDIGDDLQIKYKNSSGPQAQLESRCESISQEVGLFCDIFRLVIAELERLILDFNPNSEYGHKLANLSCTLLEPLLYLNQELASLRTSVLKTPHDKSLVLPPLFEAPPDMLHDSFLLASYFSQIRLFLADQGIHPKQAPAVV